MPMPTPTARFSALLQLLLSALSICLPLYRAEAADIALTVTLTSVDDRVNVQVKNSGKDPAAAVAMTVTLAERTYEQPLISELPAGESIATTVDVDAPRVQGSYPLYALIHYRNGAAELTSAHVGIFNVQREAVMAHECQKLDRFVRSGARYTLTPPADSKPTLFAGPEFKVTRLAGPTEFSVEKEPVLGSLQLQSSVFAVFERHSTRLHETAICRGTLSVPNSVHARSLFPTWFVVLLLAGAFGMSFIWHRRAQETGSGEARQLYLLRSRAAFVLSAWSIFLLFYRCFPALPELLVKVFWSSFGGETASSLERWIQPLFLDSANYAPFFHFLADPLLLYLLLAHYYFLRRAAARGNAPIEDKLYSLIAICFASLTRTRRTLPVPGAHIAGRALLVKAIFLPLLGSWMISTALSLIQIVADPAATGDWLYRFSYHSLLLIDVTIFAASYFIELPRLKNQIRSVEPTILGWTVCLACYPPLNDLLLIPIDHALFGYNPEWGAIVRGIVSTLIILLWAVYVWATVSLGWKASNLTHRGIVQHGPYRYCRHPAYAAKLTIWTLSGIFLGTMTVPLLAALLSLYGLRMWTEERHLAIDAEYRAYMKRVPWRVLPYRW